jgi:hypothetical protein
LGSWGLRLKLAIMVAVLIAGTAEAQQKAPQAKAPEATSKSACNEISDAATCKARRPALGLALIDSKTGEQKRKAYCRTKSKPPAKKAKDAPKA